MKNLRKYPLEIMRCTKHTTKCQIKRLEMSLTLHTVGSIALNLFHTWSLSILCAIILENSKKRLKCGVTISDKSCLTLILLLLKILKLKLSPKNPCSHRILEMNTFPLECASNYSLSLESTYRSWENWK